MRFLAYFYNSPLIHNSGAEIYLQTFLEKLSSKGNECYCLCWKNEGKRKKVNGVTYFYENSEKDFIDFLDAKRPDFVITQLIGCEKVINECKKRKIRVIYIVHNDVLATTGSHIKMLSENDICIFNTYWIHRKLAKNTFAETCVMHPIIKTEEVKSSKEFITFVNPIKLKGSDIFYRVALMMKDKQFLVVKGGYGKQEIIDSIPNITFIENTNKIYKDVWSKTRILFQPSLTETYGMTAAEAAYCGIPSVVSDSAGFRENLDKAAIFVKSLSPSDWCDAIKKLDNEQTYERYSEACKERILSDMAKDYFSSVYEIIKRKYVSIYY